MNNAQSIRRSEERALLETQLVGGIIAHSAGRKPYLASDVTAICSRDMFLGPKAKAVFSAIQAVTERGENVDLVTIGQELKAQAKTGKGKPAVELADLALFTANANGMITEQSVIRAANTVAEEWRKDVAALELEKALQAMRVFSEPTDAAISCMLEAQNVLDSGWTAQDALLDRKLDAYERKLAAPEKHVKPTKTPWDNLNRILRGGVLPGELVILAARPSVGKSALALNWALSVASSGLLAQFYSLEMGEEQLVERMLANAGGIDVGGFRQGLTPHQRRLAFEAVGALRGKAFELYDDATVTVGEIRRRVRLAQRQKKNVGLVVVDYLQLVTPSDGRVPREQQVAAMSRGFKLLAKDLNVPVLLLAQLSRKGEDANREPILSDLRESGSIEQDADIVIFLHQARRSYSNPSEPVKCIVAKGRSSGVGAENLAFNRREQRFTDSTEAEFVRAYNDDRRWVAGEQGELE